MKELSPSTCLICMFLLPVFALVVYVVINLGDVIINTVNFKRNQETVVSLYKAIPLGVGEQEAIGLIKSRNLLSWVERTTVSEVPQLVVATPRGINGSSGFRLCLQVENGKVTAKRFRTYDTQDKVPEGAPPDEVSPDAFVLPYFPYEKPHRHDP